MIQPSDSTCIPPASETRFSKRLKPIGLGILATALVAWAVIEPKMLLDAVLGEVFQWALTIVVCGLLARLGFRKS
jgi:hypothetical protein